MAALQAKNILAINNFIPHSKMNFIDVKKATRTFLVLFMERQIETTIYIFSFSFWHVNACFCACAIVCEIWIIWNVTYLHREDREPHGQPEAAATVVSFNMKSTRCGVRSDKGVSTMCACFFFSIQSFSQSRVLYACFQSLLRVFVHNVVIGGCSGDGGSIVITSVYTNSTNTKYSTPAASIRFTMDTNWHGLHMSWIEVGL